MLPALHSLELWRVWFTLPFLVLEECIWKISEVVYFSMALNIWFAIIWLSPTALHSFSLLLFITSHHRQPLLCFCHTPWITHFWGPTPLRCHLPFSWSALSFTVCMHTIKSFVAHVCLSLLFSFLSLEWFLLSYISYKCHNFVSTYGWLCVPYSLNLFIWQMCGLVLFFSYWKNLWQYLKYIDKSPSTWYLFQ